MTVNAAWVALSLVPRIGNKTIDNLLETFGNPETILTASKKDLTSLRGIGEKTASAIQAIDLEAFQRNLEQWQQTGILVITRDDPMYPEQLRTTPDPPLTIFIRGKYTPQAWDKTVAIIGTRNPTEMSRAVAQQIATAYANKGWIVVSGLALGIDAAAHQGALATQGTTLAVLGGGVLNIYPPQHGSLAEKIMNNGTLISENPPDATAIASRLVTRNRIISGLSKHVIIIQSDIKGGAMHAARAAQEQKRQLFTVDWAFSGNLALIQQGAIPINPHNPVIPST